MRQGLKLNAAVVVAAGAAGMAADAVAVVADAVVMVAAADAAEIAGVVAATAATAGNLFGPGGFHPNTPLCFPSITLRVSSVPVSDAPELSFRFVMAFYGERPMYAMPQGPYV